MNKFLITRAALFLSVVTTSSPTWAQQVAETNSSPRSGHANSKDVALANLWAQQAATSHSFADAQPRNAADGVFSAAALAQKTPAGAAPASATTTTTTTTTAQPASHVVGSVSKSLASTCVGFFCGMPICFARKLPEEIKNGAHGLAGSFVNDEGNHPLILIPAGIIWSPCAAVMAAIESPFYSLRDAYMAKHAFSKESFSLEALDPPTFSK